MQYSQRLDQKLYMLREEVRTMSREKEQVENVWRERLLRCQGQLQAKEEEMSRQSQYFENFKSQLQYKLKQSRDKEETLQSRIYTLEKQVLEMTVTAATGIATIGPVRVTAGTVTHWEQQDRLPSLRGQGEGEEEKKEERKRQRPMSLGNEREGAEKDGQRDKDSNVARLQGFILSLQEDLRVLLEREEKAMTEQRALMEQLHDAQESNHFLGRKVEEMKSEIHQLNLCKVSLEEEVEELREENQRLQQSLRDVANTLPNTEDMCIQKVLFPAVTCSCSKVELNDECKSGLSAVPLSHHQAEAVSSHNGLLDHSAAKSETSFIRRNGPQTFFGNFGSKPNPCFQPLRLTTETIDELRIGTWCYNGVLNLEESPSEDSDALREAYRSLGLGEELSVIEEQRDRLEDALQQEQEQLQVIAHGNAQLKSQIKQQWDQEAGLEQDSSKEMVCEETEKKLFSLGTDDLVQALNEENRALADRIQELRAHIELREDEIQKEQIHVKEHICKLEADGARQQEENHEQGCLITELTRKTEDDLNTIMELQQKLMEYEQCKEDTKHNKPGGFQTKHTQTVFSEDNLDKCVDMLVNCVIEGDKEPQFTSDEPQENMNDASQMMNRGKSPDNLHASVLSEQVDQLTKMIQSLKTEQEELTGCIQYQREQQKEVSQSIQAQTEEKQRLTREIWGLKEEKDHVFKSLAGLKQERERLTRAVCGLKDERDQFQRSTSGLKEEKEQLSEELPTLKKEKDALLESISSGIKERDKALLSLETLQNESHQLSQAVLNLKQERDELTRFLMGLEERRDKVQQYETLHEECTKLTKSVSSLKEEEVRIEFSISRLKQEEQQMMLLLQEQQDEHSRLQTTSPSQTQTREKVTLQPLKTVLRGTEYEEEDEARCQNNLQNPNALMMETETLWTELQQSQEELEKTLAEKKSLQNERFQCEARREEAERRASQSADHLLRLTDVANQLEETRNQNGTLKAKVNELQSKVTGLARDKSEALTMKGQIEEQYNILTAQLKAKTVALEELNSEYISLKQGHRTKDNLSTVLVSLQTRYNDIRAKYDALLHRKSQADLDIAPLKAKLSCLVVKCQERNSMLVQMTKVMQKHGCVDYILKQQVEQLLCDSALQSYASTFTAGVGSGFTPRIMINFEDVNTLTPEQPCSAVLTPLQQQQQRVFTPESKTLGGDKSPSLTTAALTTTATTHQNSTLKMKPESLPTPEKQAISPKPLSPKQLKELLRSTSPSVPQKENAHTTQFPPSARGLSGFQQLNIKAESSPDLTRLSESSGFSSSPLPTSSFTRFSPSKRLSSPGMIMSLQEQLQKTLLSSYQDPEGRGRGQKPKKYLSFSSLSPASQIQKHNLSIYNPAASPLPVTTASSDAEPASGGTTKHAALNKQTTLFNAVVSRSATLHFSPMAPTFTQQRSKASVSRTSSSVSTLSNSLHASAVQSNTKLTSSSGANEPISPTLANKVTTNVSGAAQKASLMQNKMTLSVRPAATNSDEVKCPDTPKSTASDTTAPSRSDSLSIISKRDGSGGLLSAPHSKSSGSSEKARTPTRTKQDAPAEVRSIEVIKTVGLSSLMIGWERPLLDELGCSNGTFVYGYRVFVDGVFHKSVMSSACTKCILENVNLSVPINISVQTLGSNGLCSNSVHTMYGSARTADQ